MKPGIEFVVIIGNEPSSGVILNKTALMKHYQCEVFFEVYLYSGRGKSVLGEQVKHCQASRIMVHTWANDERDPRAMIALENATCITAEEAAVALGAEWVQPGREKKTRGVLQGWVLGLPMMQQTVLLTAVRGPDGHPKYGDVKLLLRWYRRCLLLSAMDGAVLGTPYAEGGGSFTGPSLEGGALWDRAEKPVDSPVWYRPMDDLVSAYLRKIDALPHHFQMHFMHAVEILGYKHPDAEIRCWWHMAYQRLVGDMHLWPETEEQMNRRLGDDLRGWLERADPATAE